MLFYRVSFYLTNNIEMKKSSYMCTSCKFIYTKHPLICPICETATRMQAVDVRFEWKSIASDALLVIVLSVIGLIAHSLLSA